MKAIIYTEYGSPDVFKLSEVAKPSPKSNEVLIRIRATTVNYGDLVARNFKNVGTSGFNMPAPLFFLALLSFGVNRPKQTILGSELAGDIEAVGDAVTRFKVGDQVIAYPGSNMGAYAEYICMAENDPIIYKPHHLSYEEAAVLPYGAIMALPLMQKANIQPGQKVLINGASGAIGAAAVQIAKDMGAEVTGVCGTARMEFVRKLGAHHVIDYTREDFTQNGKTYDLIFDILGRAPFAKTKHSLNPGGVHMNASFKTRQLIEMFQTRNSDKKVVCAMASGSPADLEAAGKLIAAGKIKASIDRRFPLEQMAEAHRYIEAGKKQGNIAILVSVS